MSLVLWCDFGAHPFSANDPDAKPYLDPNPEEGKTRERIDICGPCRKSGKFRPRFELGAIDAAPPTAPEA